MAHLGRVSYDRWVGRLQCAGLAQSNIQTPVSMDEYSRLITEVNTKKGDCVIFCEAW